MPRKEVKRYIDSINDLVEDRDIDSAIQQLIDFKKRHQTSFKRIEIEAVDNCASCSAEECTDCASAQTLTIFGYRDETEEEMILRKEQEKSMKKYQKGETK